MIEFRTYQNHTAKLMRCGEISGTIEAGEIVGCGAERCREDNDD